MKKKIKQFYKQNKILLIFIPILLLLFIITIFMMFKFISSKPEIINDFVQTKELSSEILPFSILAIVGILAVVTFVILITITIIKIIIPDRSSLSGTLMKDEIKFLIDLPKNIRKEIIDNE